MIRYDIRPPEIKKYITSKTTTTTTTSPTPTTTIPTHSVPCPHPHTITPPPLLSLTYSPQRSAALHCLLEARVARGAQHCLHEGGARVPGRHRVHPDQVRAPLTGQAPGELVQRGCRTASRCRGAQHITSQQDKDNKQSIARHSTAQHTHHVDGHYCEQMEERE